MAMEGLAFEVSASVALGRIRCMHESNPPPSPYCHAPHSASEVRCSRVSSSSCRRLTRAASMRPRSQFDFEDFAFLFAFSWSISIFSVVYRALQDIYFQARWPCWQQAGEREPDYCVKGRNRLEKSASEEIGL